jgi:hypothetical protein
MYKVFGGCKTSVSVQDPLPKGSRNKNNATQNNQYTAEKNIKMLGARTISVGIGSTRE